MSDIIFEPYMPFIIPVWAVLMVGLIIACIVVYLKRRKEKKERLAARYEHKFH